jgi:hypothetical protein
MMPPPAPAQDSVDLGDDFGDGGDELSLDSPAAGPAAPTAGAPRRDDGGEALLREALSKASREVIEKIAWEVVPALAETIIREELERLIKEREGRS